MDSEHDVVDVRVVAANQAPWDDVRHVFGTRGDPSTCFCQFFRVSASEWEAQDVPAFERALCAQQAEAGAGPGVIAYLGDEPVGWAQVTPRSDVPRIGRSQFGELSPHAETPELWAITCFVVRVGHRRRGVAGALIRGAVDHARAHGAQVIEGYPVDTNGEKAPSADLYHGTLSLFLAAGFREIARPTGTPRGSRRALVQLEV